jgi:transposase
MVLPNLGVDQSKRTFDVCLLCGDKQRKRKFSNDEAGFRALSQWLVGCNAPVVQVCIESTGRYFHPLAEYMFEHGHSVKVANPARVVAHRESIGKRHKTDGTDAFVIADFAAKNKLRDWKPAPAYMHELRDIVGQIQLIKKHKTAYTNRAECGLRSELVKARNMQRIDDCEKDIAALEKQATSLIRSNEKLSRVFEILMSVPGIGPVCSLALIAQIDFSSFRNGRDLAVFLGLAPKLSQSGETENRTKSDKQGDRTLRALLIQAATSAKRARFYAPFVKRFMQKKGDKAKLACTKAVARKMILIVHACIRNDAHFDPSYAHPLSSPA